jgi:hypothetical protein
MTEPGPVGVNVDPLGEALGPTPDGLCVEFGEVAGMDGPLGFVGPVVAVLPAGGAAPLPEVPLAELCANAQVLDSASAVANEIIRSFMVVSLVW